MGKPSNHSAAPNGLPNGTSEPHAGNQVSKTTAFKTSIAEQPVTEERKPYLASPSDTALHHAGTARATLAASHEAPDGTTEHDWASSHQHQTVVQQHVEYWDTDHDGVIWPQDVYTGCRRFGWSPPLAALTTFLISGNLSYPTLPGWLPDPFFRIYMDKLYKDKHGSDSMTYDAEGRFRPQNFEDLFAKYDKGNKGGLDWSDLMRLWKGQRMVLDFFGWSATFLECEWHFFYGLLIFCTDVWSRAGDVSRHLA